MRYYIIDDEIGMVKSLENIIEYKDLGAVIGIQTNPELALDEILSRLPDIVIVDLLMNGMDGISLVEQVKEKRKNVSFVMISQVSDKEMVEQAYNAGVEFFINKPINVIEVEKVLNNVANKIKMENMVLGIKGIVGQEETKNFVKKDELHEINIFLGFLGMLGEKGTADIQLVCRYLMENNVNYSKDVLTAVGILSGDSSKNIEQRIRRAVKKGLNNIAEIGIDDFSNEIFQIYANYVFDFKNIKEEMEYIKGKTTAGGRINLSKFFGGLMLYEDSK